MCKPWAKNSLKAIVISLVVGAGGCDDKPVNPLRVDKNAASIIIMDMQQPVSQTHPPKG